MYSWDGLDWFWFECSRLRYHLRLSKKTKSSKISLHYLGKTLQEFKTLGGFTKCQKNALNVKVK